MIDLKAKHPYRHAWEALTDALDEVSKGWQQTENPTTDAVNAIRRFKAEVVACKNGYDFWHEVDAALTERLGPIWKSAGGNLGEAAALWIRRSADAQAELEEENKALLARIKELQDAAQAKEAIYGVQAHSLPSPLYGLTQSEWDEEARTGREDYESGFHRPDQGDTKSGRAQARLQGWDAAKAEDDAHIQANDDRERSELEDEK